MKAIATILIIGMSLLGMNQFINRPVADPVRVEQSCEKDCCGTHVECGDEKEGSDLAHTCPNSCDCSCCYHVMAVTFQFLSLPGNSVQAHHYVPQENDYFFEYNSPLFQPPRMG
jgi:hypothetical protein